MWVQWFAEVRRKEAVNQAEIPEPRSSLDRAREWGRN
jgi:hypothetical protein